MSARIKVEKNEYKREQLNKWIWNMSKVKMKINVNSIRYTRNVNATFHHIERIILVAGHLCLHFRQL